MDSENQLLNQFIENVPYTLGKIGAKYIMNIGFPGSGAVIDLAEACNDFYNHDFLSAALKIGSAIIDLHTAGIFGAAKRTAQEVGKSAAIDAAKKTAKETTKKIGRNASKDIAKGVSTNIATKGTLINVAKETTKRVILKSGGKQVIVNVTEEILMDAATEAFRQAQKETSKSVALAASKKAVADILLQAKINKDLGLKLV